MPAASINQYMRMAPIKQYMRWNLSNNELRCHLRLEECFYFDMIAELFQVTDLLSS